MNNEALAHNIRGWVHYDNMTTALQKQLTNARKQRDSFEEQVHILLNEHQMSNAVIQISGGQLQLQEEKATAGITMKALQESIHSFFKSHPEIPNPDKLSTELLQHIKEQRPVSTSTRLKKLKAGIAQP
jgi:methionyl-tRNA synthetase